MDRETGGLSLPHRRRLAAAVARAQPACAYEEWHAALLARLRAERGLPGGALDGHPELAALPREVFLADDALGWSHQAWQAARRSAVNARGGRIGGADLGAVTQLFSERYMVRFLLENSLGAWWAARHPGSPLVADFAHLRGATPPAGWPERAADVTVIDPCCGAGGFLVEAFSLLWRMRAEEEGLAPAAAQGAVLRDNLVGLDLDPRCVALTRHTLALCAGGREELPRVACSGVAVEGGPDEWRQAPALGSLLAPRPPVPPGHLAMLAGRYTLAATNVPYLGRGLQDDALRAFLERDHPDAAQDLATAFVERLLGLAQTLAVVTPHGWLFLRAYERFRRRVVRERALRLTARLGSGAFPTISGEVVKVALTVLDGTCDGRPFHTIDVQSVRPAAAKAAALRTAPLTAVDPARLLARPGAALPTARLPGGAPLSARCDVFEGTKPGQTARATRYFWELPAIGPPWRLLQTSPDGSAPYSGATKVVLDDAALRHIPESNGAGRAARGRPAVLVAKIGHLPASLAAGEAFDNNTFAIVPRDPADLGAVWAFARSGELGRRARALNQKLDVSQGTLAAVPFAPARRAAPLPARTSADPTQWLFAGRPEGSTAPRHVALARLLGYRWPAQAPDELDALSVSDGIAVLPEAAERLAALLAAAGCPPGPDLEPWLRHRAFREHCALFRSRPFVWHVWDGRRDGFAALANAHRLDRGGLERLAGLAPPGLADRLARIIEGDAPYDVYVRWKAEQAAGWDPDPGDGVRLNIRPFVLAGVLRARFPIHWRDDRGREPDGTPRRNDVHVPLAAKAGR